MSFLIPIGVVVYAAIGGLKATFTTSYMHMVIVFCLTLIFMFKVYVPGDLLGGIDDVGQLPRSLHGLPLALKASPSLVHTGIIPVFMFKVTVPDNLLGGIIDMNICLLGWDE